MGMRVKRLLCFLITIALIMGSVQGATVTAHASETTVTWNSLSGIVHNYTFGGVTLTVLSGEIRDGHWGGSSPDASFKFEASEGNFKRIEIVGDIQSLGGDGWVQTDSGALWTGDASEVTCGMTFDDVTKIEFAIGDPNVNVTSVDLNETAISLTMPSDIQFELLATVNPDNATNKAIAWSSSDDGVATVSSTGIVTAIGKGTATITATATNGTSVTTDDVMATCNVTVRDGTALQDKIEEAKNYIRFLPNDGCSAVKETLGSAVSAAVAVQDNADASQTDYDSALSMLDAALAEAKNTVNVINLVMALPSSEKVTTDSKEAIEAARAAYGALTDAQKLAVGSDVLAKLEEAEIALVNSLIDALPSADKVTMEDKAAIETARRAYDSLTPGQRERVHFDTIGRLEAAEAAYRKLERAGGGTAMYRFYNPYSGEHFYTASAEEGFMLSSIGWQYEGVGWIAPNDSDAPVFRLYNPTLM